MGLRVALGTLAALLFGLCLLPVPRTFTSLVVNGRAGSLCRAFQGRRHRLVRSGMASGAPLRRTVNSPEDLLTIVSKSPCGLVLLPGLADEDSPEGWQVMGETPRRVEATVKAVLTKALHDLQYDLPEEYRDLPEVKEQCHQLRSLISGEGGSWPFDIELHDKPGSVLPGGEIRADVSVGPDGEAPRWLQAYLDGGDPREYAPSEFREAGPGELAQEVVEDSEPVELGAARTLRRCVIAPGNGCDDIRDANWYGWLADRLEREGVFDEVICETFPDPYDAKCSIWLPFMKDKLRVGPDTVLVGHSSGAEAAMRLAEETPIGGVVLVSACHTDLGDSGERASGYYPPSGGAWQWDRIRRNTGWILQFHSADDHLVPVQEGRLVAQKLQSDYRELTGHSHFFEPFEELVEGILQRLRA